MGPGDGSAVGHAGRGLEELLWPVPRRGQSQAVAGVTKVSVAPGPAVFELQGQVLWSKDAAAGPTNRSQGRVP